MSGTVATQGTSITVKLPAATTGQPGFTATAIAGFTNFSGIGGGSPTIIDASDLSSTAKQKRVGLPDEGQAKLSFNQFDADPGQALLASARSARALVDILITLSNGDKYEFNGYVLTCEPSGGVDKINTLAVTIEITGAVTLTPHA